MPAHPARRLALLLVLTVVAAGCADPGTPPGPSAGGKCYGSPGTAYGHGATLTPPLQGPAHEVAVRLAQAVDDNLTSDEPAATATIADGGWRQWTTERGNVTIHVNGTGTLTRAVYAAARVWPSLDSAEAEARLREVLAGFGAAGDGLQITVGNNTTQWVHLVFGQFLQREGEYMVDGTAGTLTSQRSVHGDRPDDVTFELRPLYDLTATRRNVTFDDAAFRASKALECVFKGERHTEDPMETLDASPVRLLAVVGDSLVYRIAFTYGADCHDQRERKVDVDAQTGAIHAVTAPRVACVDRDAHDD